MGAYLQSESDGVRGARQAQIGFFNLAPQTQSDSERNSLIPGLAVNSKDKLGTLYMSRTHSKLLGLIPTVWRRHTPFDSQVGRQCCSDVVGSAIQRSQSHGN
eukprot:sb/3478398/